MRSEPAETRRAGNLSALCLLAFFTLSQALALLFVLCGLTEDAARAAGGALGLLLPFAALRRAVPAPEIQGPAEKAPLIPLFLLILGAAGGGIFISAGLLRLLPHGAAAASTAPASLSPVWLLGVLVVQPLLEEWAFRGVLLSRLRGFGERFAIIAAAALFALAHRSALRFPVALFAGLALGFAAAKTGSLRLNAAAHILYNVLGLLWQTGALPTAPSALLMVLLGLWALSRLRGSFPGKTASARDYLQFFAAPAMWAVWLFLLGGFLL